MSGRLQPARECDPRNGESNMIIVRARTIVTMDGAPIEDGAVAVTEERIADVGRFGDVIKRNAGEITDLGEQILLPGLINAHCHLDYTCLRGKIPPPNSFTDWIRAINEQKANLSLDDYVASIQAGFAEARKFGTTTIANLTAFPSLIARIDSPMRTWWFPELIDVRQPQDANTIVNSAVEYAKSMEHWGLAPHALFTASPELFRACARSAALLTTHLAESNEEMSMFRDAYGPLYEFLRELGRGMTDCGRFSPTEIFLKVEAANVARDEKSWLLVHANELSESDLESLAWIKRHVSIAHCPRSHRYFGRNPFPLNKFRELGLNVCLGTDSLASNEDLNLFAELRTFQKSQPIVSPTEILKMVTIKSARALNAADRLGRLKSGFFADLIAIPESSSKSDVYETVIDSQNSVSWMMIGGKVSASSTV
jgi:cytosine/adenosine deaminase-related metal-dependent hydrolase